MLMTYMAFVGRYQGWRKEVNKITTKIIFKLITDKIVNQSFPKLQVGV